MNGVFINDRDIYRDLLRERRKLGHDRYDEVWNGVYVMPTLPNLAHQELVHELDGIFGEVVVKEKKGKVYPGANVSDRPKNWKKNYRCPDIAVVLQDGLAVNCDIFLLGGPDFITEIRSPQEDPREKVPFYSKIHVRELLIVDRDSRVPTLLRHNGKKLTAIEPSVVDGEKWLSSEVLPLAFRRAGAKANPKLEIKRTDGEEGHWLV